MNRGLTGHVPALGAVLIVHGALMVLTGLFVAVGAVVLVVSGLADGEELPPLIGGCCCYALICLCAFLGGGLQIYGGICGTRWTNYKMFKVAVLSTAAGLGTCYCIMTSVGLLVWGWVVVNDEAVQERFRSPKPTDDALSEPETFQDYS